MQRVIHLTTPTAHIFLLSLQRISLQLLIFRTDFRHFTPQVQYSMRLSVRSFLHGSQQLSSYAPSLRITSFLTIQCHLHIRSARTTVILPVSSSSALSAVRTQRFTPGSQVTTDLYRTGMQERLRSTRTEQSTLLKSQPDFHLAQAAAATIQMISQLILTRTQSPSIWKR